MIGQQIMRVCDWIAEYLYNIGVSRVHGLMGGGASGLNDGFIKNGKINYICYHHEQGAGHSAIGESKFTGKLSVVNPTTGCAGTNCATSVLDAWQDSVPVLFISGNVRLDTCSSWINEKKNINIRKYGVQEHNVIDTFKSMTKIATFITSVEDVAYRIQEAVYIATSGRPGPVWIDIPSNIQTAEMPEKYNTYQILDLKKPMSDFSEIKQKISESQRPVILAGYGIRQSNTVDQFVDFIEKYQVPYVSTYGARDYTADNHPLSIGTVGIKGSRAGNFAMQNADLLLVLGSSLNSSVIGYDPKQFSPTSYKIVIDLDINELKKDVIKIDSKYNINLNKFFKGML
jgi:acetolactate synthase-1/2/3 large subunit